MDRHERALESFLRTCRAVPSVAGVLAYGSFARGDYGPASDIDLAVLLDSRTLAEDHVRQLVRAIRRCHARYRVRLDADFLLDSEADLFNRGIVLHGRAFSDLAIYRDRGRVVYGEDLRRRLRVPPPSRRSRRLLLAVVESHFKEWLFHHPGRKVPWWFPAWATTVALNADGVLELRGREDMFGAVRTGWPTVWRLRAFRKVRENPKRDVLTADEFLSLLRALRRQRAPRR